LCPEHFSDKSAEVIFRSISKLYIANKAIDEIMISSDMNCPFNEIVAISDLCDTPSSAEFFLKKVLTEYAKKEATRIIKRTEEEISSAESPDEVAEIVSARMSAMKVSGSVEKTWAQSIDEAVEEIKKENGPNADIGMARIGIQSIDHRCGLLKPGELLVIAARPSVGKSALAVNAAVSNAINGLSVKYFSLEMTTTENIKRMLQSALGCQLRVAKESEIKAKAESLKKLDIKIFSTPMTMQRIMSLCEMESVGRSIGIIFIDYLQLIMTTQRNSNKNRENEVAEISRSAKGLAKRMKCPIVLLAQLNRSCEIENREPQMKDLRESGSIEQDADKIAMLHKSGNIIKFLMRKNRGGMLASENLLFDGSSMSFSLAPIPQNAKIYD